MKTPRPLSVGARVIEVRDLCTSRRASLDRKSKSLGGSAASFCPHRVPCSSSEDAASGGLRDLPSCSAAARRFESRSAASCPAFDNDRPTTWRGLRFIQSEDSVDAATAPSFSTARAMVSQAGSGAARQHVPEPDVTTSGPTKDRPQRSCSFFASVPCSLSADRDVLAP